MPAKTNESGPFKSLNESIGMRRGSRKAGPACYTWVSDMINVTWHAHLQNGLASLKIQSLASIEQYIKPIGMSAFRSIFVYRSIECIALP